MGLGICFFSRLACLAFVLRFWESELAEAGIAAGAPGEELLGAPRGVGSSTVVMAKGKKQKSAMKLALSEAVKPETKVDAGNDAVLNRPSPAALASAGAPGATSTPSRGGKQLWALDSVTTLAPAATKKRSMFMSAYKSLKRAAGIPSKKAKSAEKAKKCADATTAPRLDGALPDVLTNTNENENAVEHAAEHAMQIPRLDTARALSGRRAADDKLDRKGSESESPGVAYLDALRRALPSDVRPDRNASFSAAVARELSEPSPGETPEPSETAETRDARLPEAPRERPDASPLSPPRARFARTLHRLVGDMRRRHESSVATARGMLRSLDALEGLEPAAVAFGRVQRRADAAFWSGLPPVALDAVETTSARTPRARNANEPNETDRPPSRLAPTTKPPTPRVVAARHEARRVAEAAARESARFASRVPNVSASRSVSAPASPTGAFPLNEANEAAAFSGRAIRLFRGANAPAPAAAAVAAAVTRVTPPASVARRLAAAEATRGSDAETPETRRSVRSRDASSSSEDSSESELAPRFGTWVAGRGGSRVSAAAVLRLSAAALAAARARDAARGIGTPSSSAEETPAPVPTASARGGGAPASPPARRAGDLDRLRAMRRRLRAEYTSEARAARARHRDAPSDAPSARTAFTARDANLEREGRTQAKRRSRESEGARGDEPATMEPSASRGSPRDGFVPRAVGSPATAEAGFEALSRRREARRAAEANAVRRRWTGGEGRAASG